MFYSLFNLVLVVTLCMHTRLWVAPLSLRMLACSYKQQHKTTAVEGMVESVLQCPLLPKVEQCSMEIILATSDSLRESLNRI
jgi:hypothetical protein